MTRTEPDPTVIRREILIDARVERVWTVLTEGRHLGAWFGDAGATIDLRPGGSLVCHWHEHGTIEAVVTIVEPPHRFGFRWAGPLASRPSPGNATDVTFTLTSEGERTRLRVVESGFEDLAVGAEQRARYLAGNTEGWEFELDELRRYLAKGVAT